MRIISILKTIYYKLLSPNQCARILGVNFGNNCKFRTKDFGSEPYLIKMGDNVATSAGVRFITHDGSVHVLRNLYGKPNLDLFGQIIIQNNVFIGLNTIILPGTEIGENTIVGAGSVVKGKLNKNSVYAGVPAKYLFSIEEYYQKNINMLDNTYFLKSNEKKTFLEKKYHI